MRKPPPGCDPRSIVLTFPVAREQAGLRLDRFLQSRIPRISRTRAQRIVKKCAMRADGTRRRASERVKAGETVIIVRPPMNEPPTPQHFGVLFEDDEVLAVDKPSGLPMHPTATYHRHTLTWLLYERFGEDAPQFAHRLDRETSGVVVCGKCLEAEVSLKRAFEDRKTRKGYLAIVRGSLETDEGSIERPIRGAREGLHVRMVVAEDGQRAETHFRVLERRAGTTLVSLTPVTGRQHQLRVHLAAIGHPIVGDKLYGPEGSGPFIEAIDGGPSEQLLARLGHPRQALHASWLEVPHPATGEAVRFESPLPWDLERLWADPGAALGGEAQVSFEALLAPPEDS